MMVTSLEMLLIVIGVYDDTVPVLLYEYRTCTVRSQERVKPTLSEKPQKACVSVIGQVPSSWPKKVREFCFYPSGVPF